MDRELTLFLALTKVAVGNAESLPFLPTEQDWKFLFSMANKHTIAGPLFATLDKLPAEQRPPRKIFVDWLATTEKIKHDSREATQNAIWVSKKFMQVGFRNIILKGQGNALLYPDPLLRHPGDVDIWLEGSRDKIIGYVRKFFPNIRIQWVEMDFPIKKGCSIEVHTIPSFMSNPFDNRKLKQYFMKHADELFSNPPVITEEGALRVPTTQVNMLFQLSHIYRHLFNEGKEPSHGKVLSGSDVCTTGSVWPSGRPYDMSAAISLTMLLTSFVTAFGSEEESISSEGIDSRV